MVEALVILAMTVLYVILFLLFRNFVCWYWKIDRAVDHLENIDQSLKQLVKQFSVTSATEYETVPVQGADESQTDNELMERYGITFENDKYNYESYSYDRLEDAVNYAKKMSKE
jgi:hypothetical protein